MLSSRGLLSDRAAGPARVFTKRSALKRPTTRDGPSRLLLPSGGQPLENHEASPSSPMVRGGGVSRLERVHA